MQLGRQFAKFGRTLLSPQKYTPLSTKLSYSFACIPILTQKKYSLSLKSQTLSLKESSLNSLKNKDNGLITIKPSQMSRLIRLLSRSKVQPQEFLSNYMQPVETPYLSENHSLVLMLMQPNQKERDRNQLRKKSNRNLQLIHPSLHKLSKLLKKLQKKHQKQINLNKLLHHHLPQFFQDKENKLVNLCQD